MDHKLQQNTAYGIARDLGLPISKHGTALSHFDLIDLCAAAYWRNRPTAPPVTLPVAS